MNKILTKMTMMEAEFQPLTETQLSSLRLMVKMDRKNNKHLMKKRERMCSDWINRAEIELETSFERTY